MRSATGRSTPRLVNLMAGLAALVPLLCAAPSPVDAAPAGGSLTLAIGGDVGDGFGVGVTGVATLRRGTATFPVGGLELDRPSSATLRGSLRLKAGGRRATLRHLRVALRSSRVAISARLGGKRRTFFVAEPGKRLTLDRAAGDVDLPKTSILLTRAGARALRKALGFKGLSPGAFGRVALVASLKAGSSLPAPLASTPAPTPAGPATQQPTDPPVDPPADPPVEPDPYAFCPVTAGTGPGTPGGQPGPPALGPALTTPQPIASGAIDWGFRASFRSYVSAGDGNPPLSTLGGATIAPGEAFSFPVGGGQFEDAAAPRAIVDGGGTAIFCYPGHFFRIAMLNPTATIDGAQSRLTVDVESNQFGTEYGPWRSDVATLDTSDVTVEYSNDGQTATWRDLPATLTADGASAFAGFYGAGQELDPITVTAGDRLAAPETRVASRADMTHDPSQAIGNSDSEDMQISANGRYVAFESYADNLVPGDAFDTQDVFVRDLRTRRATRVSVDGDGLPGAGAENGSPQISADGRHVVFLSDSALVAADTNGEIDVYVRDTVAETTMLVSVAADASAAGGLSGTPSISADGDRVAFFSTAANLVAGDTNGLRDAFVRDIGAGTTIRTSLADDEAEATVAVTAAGGISADGEHVVFASTESTLVAGDTNGFRDAFVRDLAAGTTTLVSLADDESQSGAHVDLSATSAAGSKISGDGNRVIFYSPAVNLVAGDGNGLRDCFVRDVAAGTTVRVNVSAAGAESAVLCGNNPTISADGSTVAFSSEAADLVPGDGNGMADVFVRAVGDPATIRRANVTTGSVEDDGTGSTGTVSLSGHGRHVAFKTHGPALTGSSEGRNQVLVRELP